MNTAEWILGVITFMFLMFTNFRVYATLEYKSEQRERVHQAQIKFLTQELTKLKAKVYLSKDDKERVMSMKILSPDEIPEDLKEFLGGMFGSHSSDNHKELNEKEFLLKELNKYPKAVYKKSDDVDYLRTVLSLFKEEE